jgi:hypothetical protein
VLTVSMTISIGQVVQIAVTIGAVFVAYVKIMERLARIETQIEPMWREFERRRQPRGTTGS